MYTFLCTDIKGCTVWCKGKYTTHPLGATCVGYNISFHFNKTRTTKLKDFPCDIETCLIDEIDFDCTSIEANIDFNLNKTSINKEDQSHPPNKGDKKGSCIGNFFYFDCIFDRLIDRHIAIYSYVVT